MTKLLRVGECNQCGKCCDPSTLPQRMDVYQRRGIVALVKAEPCPHFYYEDSKGVCEIYPDRPEMCRVFPMMPADIEALPECGYRFIWLGKEVIVNG